MMVGSVTGLLYSHICEHFINYISIGRRQGADHCLQAQAAAAAQRLVVPSSADLVAPYIDIPSMAILAASELMMLPLPSASMVGARAAAGEVRRTHVDGERLFAGGPVPGPPRAHGQGGGVALSDACCPYPSVLAWCCWP